MTDLKSLVIWGNRVWNNLQLQKGDKVEHVCVHMQVRWHSILRHSNFQSKYYKSMKWISKIKQLISSCWDEYMKEANKTVLALPCSDITQETPQVWGTERDAENTLIWNYKHEIAYIKLDFLIIV